MKARPILFSGPMIRALLEGRKTQTRRAVRNVDAEEHPFVGTVDEGDGLPVIVFSDAPGDQVLSRVEAKCPYGVSGDLLWVRESIDALCGCDAEYVSDGRRLVDAHPEGWDVWRDGRNLPLRTVGSIHMPRWASRLTLEITEVRVERLNDISEADAYAEGVSIPSHHAFVSNGNPELRNEARDAYRELWESINGPGSWAANPWCWAIGFRVHQRNVDQVLAHLATTSTTSRKEPTE